MCWAVYRDQGLSGDRSGELIVMLVCEGSCNVLMADFVIMASQ